MDWLVIEYIYITDPVYVHGAIFIGSSATAKVLFKFLFL